MPLPIRGKASEVKNQNGSDSGDIAPTINKWVAACFPQGSQSSEDDLRELIKEAAEAARDDYDAQSAVTWAEGYEFPARYIQSDVACLRAAQLDFETMVRRRLQILSPDRLSKERVEK